MALVGQLMAEFKFLSANLRPASRKLPSLGDTDLLMALLAYLLVFLGSPINNLCGGPKNVNDPFIQPYTLMKTCFALDSLLNIKILKICFTGFGRLAHGEHFSGIYSLSLKSGLPHFVLM